MFSNREGASLGLPGERGLVGEGGRKGRVGSDLGFSSWICSFYLILSKRDCDSSSALGALGGVGSSMTNFYS